MRPGAASFSFSMLSNDSDLPPTSPYLSWLRLPRQTLLAGSRARGRPMATLCSEATASESVMSQPPDCSPASP